MWKTLRNMQIKEVMLLLMHSDSKTKHYTPEVFYKQANKIPFHIFLYSILKCSEQHEKRCRTRFEQTYKCIFSASKYGNDGFEK